MKFAAMAGSFLLSCLFLLPLAPAQAKTKTGGIIIHSAYEKTATHSLSDRLFLKRESAYTPRVIMKAHSRFYKLPLTEAT